MFGETREARIQPCSKRDKVFVGWSHLQAVSLEKDVINENIPQLEYSMFSTSGLRLS